MKKRKSTPHPAPASAKHNIRAPRRKNVRAVPKRSNPIDALVAANAKALGLSIDPGWRKSVAFNLALIMRHAALVDEFALSDEAEPAPVYRA